MILLAAFLVLSTAITAVMQRRRDSWVDEGSVPEDEPHFVGCAGNGG